jgi:hypothetical protein
MNEPVYGSPSGPVAPNGEWNVEDQLREQDVRNLKRRAEFRVHLVVYALVNLLLVAIWLATGISVGAWYPWWIFPMFGWGIGLGVHAWTAYRGDELSEQRIRDEVRRIAGTG